MINGNENETENEKIHHKYDINRPRPRHGPRYTKCKMCVNIVMVV